jgi:2-amino-4-hydroxy-6-hydroxymethyldihydropteridine diphosphokinase
MSTAYVALGSNQGERLHNLEESVRLISEFGEIHALSPIYETDPVGFADQPWFLNAVISVDSELSPLALLLALQEIERKLGKATPFLNGPRTIDLDILLYDDRVETSADLTLPHPRMHERRFVLTPLADIVPEAMHPTEHETVAQLLKSLVRSENDDAQVHPWATTSRVFPNHNRRTEIRD